jgi:hypothetical protein
MAQKRPPEFTKDKIRLAEAILVERFGEKIAVVHPDAELPPNPGATEITPCPSRYRQRVGVHFLKSRADKYHIFKSLYDRGFQQYGTEKRPYDNQFGYITSLLKAHEEKQAGNQQRIP